LVPITELFDKIDGLEISTNEILGERIRLKETTKDYLSEFLYPTKGNAGAPKSCRCYQTDLYGGSKKCAGSLGTFRSSRYRCEWSCNNDSNCQSNDSNTRIDTVFGELESCKWDANAACTWDNQVERPDCVNNCVCLLGGGITTDVCRYPLMYAQPYHLQLVCGGLNHCVDGLKRWFTNARWSKGSDGLPRTGIGNKVWMDDGADKGGLTGKRKIEPEQYQWIISSGSDPSDGSTFDENGEVAWDYDIINTCIKYDDIIIIQGAGDKNLWLTGGRNRGNYDVYMNGKWSSGRWKIRSAPIKELLELDPRHGECVRGMDHVYFQVPHDINRYLSGGHYRGDWNIYTLPNTRATAFEMRSDIDVQGRLTTKAADPPTLPREN